MPKHTLVKSISHRDTQPFEDGSAAFSDLNCDSSQEGDKTSFDLESASRMENTTKLQMRNQFPNRWSFLLAVTGYVVGYGNWWRFPVLCYTYGGITFIIPYICCLCMLGIPLVAIELGLGRLTRGGNMKSFRAMHHRMAPVGLGVFTGVITLIYYPLIIAWTLVYLFNSFKTQLPWLPTPALMAECAANTSEVTCSANTACLWNQVCLVEPSQIAVEFYDSTLSVKADFWTGITTFNGWILLAQTICVVVVFTVILGGMHFIAYATSLSVILCGAVTLTLLCAGVTLPGAGNGLKEYLGKWDSKYLVDPLVWSEAAAQVIFSLGLAQGGLTAASSHVPPSQNFMVDAYIVTLADTGVSLCAGIAVYSVLGYTAGLYGIPISEIVAGGWALVFQSYPIGIGAAFGYPGAQIFLVLFFAMLWSLGCSTIVFLYEGVASVFKESRFFNNIRRQHAWLQFWHIYAGFTVLLWLQSFLYCTDLGSWFLSGLDHFTTPFGWITVAYFECIAAGWMPAWELQKRLVGDRAAFIHLLSYLWGVALACVFGFFLPFPGNIVVAVLVGLGITIGGLAYSVHIAKPHDAMGGEFTYMERLWNVTMYNIMLFRSYLNDECCQNTVWRVPRAGMLGLKYAAPVLTNVLFFGYVSNPYYMYQFPREGPEDPSPPLTPQLFFYSQLGPYAFYCAMFVLILLPHFMRPLLPERTVEFYFDDAPRLAGGAIGVVEGSAQLDTFPGAYKHDENTTNPGEDSPRITDNAHY